MMELTVIVQSKIYEIRGQKVMIDKDLAGLCQIEVKRLNKSVKRNIKRFPSDFYVSTYYRGMAEKPRNPIGFKARQ